MKDSDVHRLFMSVLDSPIEDTDAVRGVFSALVRSTLKYRDLMRESDGTVLTVEDVRTVLDWLVPSLLTGRLPETEDKVRLGLLKLCLEELRNPGNRDSFDH